ncbi:hypothetical protein [Cellulosimicrobium sp. Marseille-Q4280]|uniref:hypothetical protein n=1 Tax=Cellulosimicrobium sp. Marseille-Q4280 TaxID=2937992 RepID=UPI00203C1D2C|nr:hypothetical protein [Cellulosimicrobium sp. Marseille-Q4280]
MRGRVPAGVSTGGQFAPGTRAEARVLLVGDVEVVTVRPGTAGELAEKLDLRRGAPDGYERRVVITARAASDRVTMLEVHGPLDGSVLHVEHESGSAPLRVISGRVQVAAAARPWSTSVRVERGAQVRVLAAPRSKVTTHTRHGASTTLVLADGARGFQHVERGGLLELEGDRRECAVSASTDVRDEAGQLQDGPGAALCPLCDSSMANAGSGWSHVGGEVRCAG